MAYFFNSDLSSRDYKIHPRIKKPIPPSPSLTLPLLLTKLPPVPCSMILRFPAFIPRSGSSYPFVFADPRDVDTRVYHTRAYTHRHMRIHVRGAIRLARGKFPAILRLSTAGIIHRVPWNFYDFHERRATSPTKIWRHERSDENKKTWGSTIFRKVTLTCIYA